MKKRLLSLVALVVLAVGLGGIASANSKIVCQSVGAVTPVAVFTPNPNRIAYSLWTTNGAATIYFGDDGATLPAGAAPGSHSAPLVGGASYTYDAKNVPTGNVYAVAKTGSVWVCGKEN